MNLCTKRLTIRSFGTQDITQTYVSWLNDPIVTRYSNQRFKEHTINGCTLYAKSFVGSENRFLALIHRESNEMIGTMTIYQAKPHGTADIGIMIGNRNYWGLGLGSEAWIAVMRELLQVPEIRKVTGGTSRANKGMMKIMKQAGMHQEAVRRDQEIIEGEPTDIVYFAIFREE